MNRIIRRVKTLSACRRGQERSDGRVASCRRFADMHELIWELKTEELHISGSKRFKITDFYIFVVWLFQPGLVTDCQTSLIFFSFIAHCFSQSVSY